MFHRIFLLVIYCEFYDTQSLNFSRVVPVQQRQGTTDLRLDLSETERPTERPTVVDLGEREYTDLLDPRVDPDNHPVNVYRRGTLTTRRCVVPPTLGSHS